MPTRVQAASTQLPLEQVAPATQSVSFAHEVLHAAVPQLYGEQLVVVAGAQVPVPLQYAGLVWVEPVHVCTPHWVVVVAYAHAVPSFMQAPVWPQTPSLEQVVAQQVPWTQWPLAQVLSLVHALPRADPHVPPVHVLPDGQTVVQFPQWWLSDVRFTHAPLHSVKPEPQLPPQTPLVQVAVPPVGAVHTFPHAPQL